MSHPSRGAWIEMNTLHIWFIVVNRRTPHGVRGLKLLGNGRVARDGRSHPSRGAWIEMRMHLVIAMMLI